MRIVIGGRDLPARGRRRGLLGAAGLLLGSPLRAGEQAGSVLGESHAKAKSVIQVWLWGGACHIDTFDPKPDAGSDYTGPLKSPIATNVDGIRIGELLPELAKQADKYSLIRSMTHGNNGHETAAYMVQTAREPGGRDVYPCAGAVVSLFKGYNAGYKGLIPPYIVVTQPQGRFSEAGFLGSRFKPFATGGDPAQDSVRGGRRGGPRHHGAAAEGPARVPRKTELARRTPCPAIRSWPPWTSATNRRTT